MDNPTEKALTKAEALDLIAAFPGTVSGKRNKAVASLVWRADLRLREVLALKLVNVGDGCQLVKVADRRGTMWRPVDLDAVTADTLKAWLPAAQEYDNGEHWLFPQVSKNTEGQPISAAYARKMLAEAGAKAGIDKAVNVTSLRHAPTHSMEINGALIDITEMRPAPGQKIFAFNVAGADIPGMPALALPDGTIAGYSYSMNQYTYVLYVTHWIPQPE